VRRPRRPFGPANRHRQPASPPPPRAAYDRWTPPVIPDLPCPSRTRPRVRLAAATESVLHTRPSAWPARQGARPGYLRHAVTPGRPHPSRPSQSAACRLAGNLERRRRRCFPIPPPLRHRGIAQELRKEVRSSPVPLVVIPEHPVALEPSPELPCRAAASSRRSAASPPRPLALLAPRARPPRLDATRASNCGQTP
jgi:hypothetical protein